MTDSKNAAAHRASIPQLETRSAVEFSRKLPGIGLTKPHRAQKAPSKNVSVRKKSGERFQSLTQILIDTMFRLEMLERRTRSERFSRKSQSQVSPVYRKLLRINALGTGRNCVAEDTRTSPSARLLAARNSLIADALPMQPAAGHWLALYPAWDAVREFACGI